MASASPIIAPGSGLGVLLRLAWPIVVARAAQSVIGFADALMVAPLGEATLAAVTTGAMNFFALVIFPMGLAYIVQSFAAQLHGRGDLAGARRYAFYGLFVSAAFFALGLAAIPATPWLLGLFPYEADVRASMSTYLAIRLLSLGVVVATEVLGNWFGGLGNTRLQMMAGVLTMVVNVALNWVLIGGRLGAPALGVAGAAWASVLATSVGLGFLGWAFVSGRVAARPEGPLRLRASELWRMLRFGVPHGLNWFLEFAAFWLFINIIIADLGTAVLAAFMVVLQLNTVAFMPAFGVSSAGAILAGQAIGDDRRDDVPAILKRTIGVMASWQISVGALYLLGPALLVGLFAPPGDAAPMLAVAATMLVLSAGWQLVDAIGMAIGEILRAAGDTAWCLWARLFLAWVVFMPASYYAVKVRGGGHVAAMLCIIVYIAALGAVFLWRFRSGAWRRIDLTGADAALVE